jgi:CheY-like chemotaxis protein
MPEMDGLTATAVLRERERGSGYRIPVIGLTAHAMESDRARCLEAGMTDYVSKPLRRDLLFAALAAIPRRPEPAPNYGVEGQEVDNPDALAGSPAGY